MANDTARRTRLQPDWLPTEDGRAYGISRGLDVDEEAEAFRDFHGARGTRFIDWNLAWRTWCRNAVEFRHRGRPYAPPAKPAATIDHADHWGAIAWAAALPDTVPGTVPGGRVVPCLGGYDAAGAAQDICAAAKVPPDWRGDLDQIAEWLRAGIDPDVVVEVIRSSRGTPTKPGSWRYYDAQVRSKGGKP